MRVAGKLLVAVLLSLGVVAVVESQQPQRPPFGGGFGGGGQGNPLSLIQNPAVQKELNLSEEQLKKLPEAVQRAIAEVLEPKQAKRLKQIQLQQRGTQALSDPKVANALKLSETQRDKIASIQESSRKEMAELFKDGGREGFQKIGALRKETQEKVQNVLSDDQRTAWKEMLGEELKLSPFGGGFQRPSGTGSDKKGDFKQRFRKKTDTE